MLLVLEVSVWCKWEYRGKEVRAVAVLYYAEVLLGVCWGSVGDLLVNLLRVKFARRPGILTVANTVWYAN
jgi:hypothetical protein